MKDGLGAWTPFLTPWIPSARGRTPTAFLGLSSASTFTMVGWVSIPAIVYPSGVLFPATFLTLLNRVKVLILANASTEVSATRVNTSRGGGTNVKHHIRSKVPQELVIARGSDGDDFGT